jgi:threonine aldolase
MMDLRSDTVTRPTPAMIEAVRAAMENPELGDETLFGDALVKRLEARAAEMTGKEAAVFVSGGTMGNLTAVFAHRRGGAEIITDRNAHMARSEFSGISVAAGLHCLRIPARRGEMDCNILRETVKIGLSRQKMPPELICIESTHNYSGGCVPSPAYMREVRAIALEAGSPVHVDGARIFNAAVALGVPVRDIAAHCDSMSFCLSKGLSAPYGAVLVGSASFISRARVFQRMLGGGMRQIGLMAAAALVALETMTERLADDHRRARVLWERIHALDAELADAEPPESNILLVRCKWRDSGEWLRALAGYGLLGTARGAGKIRLVTHRHFEDAHADEAFAAVKAAYDGFAGKRPDGNIAPR